MTHTKYRVGYITFEGLDGPRRFFRFDEPLALGLLCVLERAARSVEADGTSGELALSAHDREVLEIERRARVHADTFVALLKRDNPSFDATRIYLDALIERLKAGRL